ncbi:MAG: hypothetical protein NVS9B15_04690 [Acidobacteriaceae bacterium]
MLLQPLRESIAGDIRLPLLLLLGAVAFVLLIACANVAHLLMARAVKREAELGVRAALGATPLRLVRQAFTESLLLCAIGGAAGLLLASFSRRFLLSLFPNDIANLRIPTIEHIPLDARVIAFTLAATILTAIAFSLVPAFRSAGINALNILKTAGRGGTDAARHRRLQSTLIAAEVALSFTLMIGALLLIKSFVQLTNHSIGFDTRNVLALEVFPSPSQYPASDPEKLLTFLDRSLDNLRALPGVESAAISFLPLTGFWGDRAFTIDGLPIPAVGSEPTADNRLVSPGYFSTMRVPILRGREFTTADGIKDPKVIIVSHSLAQRFWATQDPLGKRLNLGSPDKPDMWQIVGVVGDVHSFGIAERLHDDIYRPFAQVYFPMMAFTVRTKGSPQSLIPAAKAAIWKLDPRQPFYKIITMDELASQSLALRRVSMVLLASFSAVALILASVGIYGVLSYSVSRRTREIGIRTALGAEPREVLSLILKDGLRMVALGLFIGVAAALLLLRFVSSLLYGVAPTDPISFAGSAVLIIAVAFSACYIPARQAANLDPVTTLRSE